MLFRCLCSSWGQTCQAVNCCWFSFIFFLWGPVAYWPDSLQMRVDFIPFAIHALFPITSSFSWLYLTQWGSSVSRRTELADMLWLLGIPFCLKRCWAFLQVLYFQGLLFHLILFVILTQKEDTKKKEKTQNEKAHEATEKTKQTKGPEIDRKNGASAVTNSCKNENKQRSRKPVDKSKERWEYHCCLPSVLHSQDLVWGRTEDTRLRQGNEVLRFGVCVCVCVSWLCGNTIGLTTEINYYSCKVVTV